MLLNTHLAQESEKVNTVSTLRTGSQHSVPGPSIVLDPAKESGLLLINPKTGRSPSLGHVEYPSNRGPGLLDSDSSGSQACWHDTKTHFNFIKMVAIPYILFLKTLKFADYTTSQVTETLHNDRSINSRSTVHCTN